MGVCRASLGAVSTPTKLSAAWRIVADVVAYRLRKREAANLGTTFALALALRLPPIDIAWRGTFAIVLNVFVYLVNDCFDVGIDLRAPGRDTARTRFLAANLRIAWGVCMALGGILVGLGALRSGELFAAALVNIAVIVAYSAVLKHRPGLDILAMGAWGLSMAMPGFAVTSPVGWRLAGVLGILSMVTESVQVLRDEPSDRAAGVRTTAVVLGPSACAGITRVLVLLAAVYTLGVLGEPVAAVVILPGVLVPLRPERASRSWDILRVLFGAAWVFVLVRYYLRG